MGKKRFIACLLVVLVLAVSAITLAACKPQNSPFELPDVPPVVSDVEEPAAGDLLLIMLKGMGTQNEFISMDFETDIRVNVNVDSNGKLKPGEAPVWETRKFYLKGNFKPDKRDDKGNVIEPGEVELGLSLKKDGDPSQDFEIFLHNGRFYLRVAGTALYLEDVDFKWVIEQIKKIGELQNLVDAIFGLIPDLGIKSDVDELIGLVAMLMFKIDNNVTTYDPVTKSGHIALKLEPEQLISTVIGALGGTSIDGLLASVGMTLKNPNNEPIYIDNFLKNLAFPNINVYVEADIENQNVLMFDKTTGERTGLRLNVYDYQNNYYEMATSSEFKQEKIDILPNNIKDYVPFGLLKLQFNTGFTMRMNDLDAGKVVNFFAGSNFLPENSLILSLNTDIEVKLDVDLRLKKDTNGTTGELEDNSLMAIELFKKGDSDPLLGLYLKNEKLYVNLDNFLKMASDNIDLDINPGNIVVSGVNIADWATRGLKIATDLVGGLIDNIFAKKPSDSGKANALSVVSGVEYREGYSQDDIVLSVARNSEGKAIFSKTIGQILDIVRYTTALDEFFTYESDENTGKINLCVNNKFLDKLCSQYGLNVPEIQGKDDFGEINISVNFDQNGFNNINFNVNFNENLGNIKADLVLDKFAYGFGHTEELRAYITDRITKDTPYLGNIKDLIFSAVDDLDLQFTAGLRIAAGTYKANSILGIETGLPNIEINVHNDFILELVLKIQVQMDEVVVGYETDANGKTTNNEIKEKVITRAYISITNTTKNPIFPKDNMTVRLTYLDMRYPGNVDQGVSPINRTNKANGLLYIDMSEFSMVQLGIPSFAVSMDLTETIFGALGNLDMNFEIPDFMKDLENKVNGNKNAQTFALDDNSTSNADMMSEKAIYALFNPDTAEQTSRFLKLQITTELVNAIFAMIAPTLPPEVTLPSLPNIDLTATIDRIEGITLSIKANDGGTKDISLDLAVNKFKIGSQNVIDIEEFIEDLHANPTKYGEPIDLDSIISSGGNALMGILGDVIYRALDDVNFNMNLKIHLDKGEYNISNLFGINTTLPPIPIVVSENGADIDLELSIMIQSAMVKKVDKLGNVSDDEYEQIISRAIIELKIAPNALITSGADSAVRIIYLDDRYEANKPYVDKYSATQNGSDVDGNPVYNVHKSHGTMFVNLSSLELMKLSLPDLAFDLDLNEIVAQIVDSINLSDITISNDNNVSPVQRMLSAMADGDSDDVCYVEVAFTTQVINKLLDALGVKLEFMLPNDIDGGIKISSDTGISINVAATESGKLVSASLGLGCLQLGTNLTDDQVAIPEGFDKTKFGNPATLDLNSLLNTVIYRALDDVELELDLAFSITKGTYYVDKLFGMFGLNVNGERLPIEVREDFILDLTLKVQMRWNKFVDDKQNPIGGGGVTQALISLYNKTPNILFPTGSSEIPVLTAMYIDDRGPNNAGLPNENFRKGVNGKSTNGTLFVDLSGFEFAKLKLPNIAIDLDLTKTITDIVGNLNLSDASLFGGETVESYVSDTMSRALSAVVNGDEEVKNDNNYLQVNITMKLIQELLAKFNVSLTLPSDMFEYIEGDLTISQIDGLKLQVKLPGADEDNQGNEIALKLGIKKIQLGKETIIPVVGLSTAYFASFGTRCVDDLSSILYRVLDDTDVEMKLTANVPVGKYNVAPLLKLAGIDIDQLMLEFEQEFKLDLTLRVQLQMETVMTEDEQGHPIEKTILARAKIELISYEENFIVGGNKDGVSVITFYYFDDRWAGNMTAEAKAKLDLVEFGKIDPSTGNVKSTHGTIFARFAGLSIANIAIPSIKMDLDLTELVLDALMGVVGNIGLGSNNNAENDNNARQLSTVADVMTYAESETPDLGNYIQVSVVTGLLNEILRLLNVDLGFTLPDFTVDLGAFTETGLTVTIWVKAPVEDGETDQTNRIDAQLSFPKLALGQQHTVDISTFHHSNYTTDFSNLVMGLLQYGHIEADINIGANASQVNIQRLLNELLMTSGMSIQWPITVDLNDFTNTIKLVVQWEFDYQSPTSSKILVEAKCDGHNIAAIYVTNGNVYVDLAGLGLPKFALTKSNLVAKIVNLISKELDGLLGGLLNANTAGLQKAVAQANGLSVQEMNTELFTKARDGEFDETAGNNGILSYVTVLLNGMSVKDGVIHGEFAADMIANLLSDLSINLSNNISLDVALDIFSGNLKLNARFDEVSLGAELRIMNIGNEEHIDDSRLITSGYEVLNASSASMFVTSLFNVLEPGLWMDLISKNETITREDFKLTKLIMTKVGPSGMSLPHTNGGWANGGSILLTLMRMDGYGNANGIPAVYIILDINGGKVWIRATTNLLPHVKILGGIGLDPDTMVNIAIPLDLKATLTTLLGPIITEINKVDSAASNSTPSVETTGDKELAEIFGGIDFMSILKSINVKIFGVRNIKINVELDANFINTLLPRLFNEGLNGMHLDLGGKGNTYDVRGLYYETGNNSNFLNNLWDNLIIKVVKIAAYDAGYGAVWSGAVENIVKDNLKGTIDDMVSRILPFPRLDTLNLNVYIINGKLDNIQLIGYGDGANDPKSQKRVELMIFNDNDSDGGGQVLFGTMEVGKLNDIEFQAPYIHFDASVDSPTNFENKFTTTAYKSNKEKMYYATGRNEASDYLVTSLSVDWRITYYNALGFFDADDTDPTHQNNVSVIANPAFSRGNMGAFKINTTTYRVGYYRATASVVTASGATKTMDVRVVVEDNKEFLQAATTTVDKIEIRAGEGLPDAITFRGVDAEGNEKTAYVRKVAGAMDKFTITGADKQGLHDHTVTGKVTVKFQDGTPFAAKDVDVHWFSSKFALVDTAPIEISVMEYLNFFNSLYTVNTKSDGTFEYLPKKLYVQTQNDDGTNKRRIYQDVAEITFDGPELFAKDSQGLIVMQNSKPVLSSNSGWTNEVGFTTNIVYKLKNQDKKQPTLTRQVIVKPRVVDFARFDSKNTILLDSLQSENDLPKTARVFFANGDERTFKIESWDFSGATENINGVDQSVKFEFGVDKVYDNISFTFTQDANTSLFGATGASNVVKGITIAITDAAIEYAKVGPDNGERYCDISYEDFADKKFGNLDLRLVTSSGKVVDYLNDRITFTVGFVKDAIPAGANASEYLTDADAREYQNTVYGRQMYLQSLAACEILDTDSEEEITKKNNERARWHVVTETVLNYEIVDRGITLGDKGGRARVTVILKNMKPKENDERPDDISSNYTETYLYFEVAAPIAKH